MYHLKSHLNPMEESPSHMESLIIMHSLINLIISLTFQNADSKFSFNLQRSKVSWLFISLTGKLWKWVSLHAKFLTFSRVCWKYPTSKITRKLFWNFPLPGLRCCVYHLCRCWVVWLQLTQSMEWYDGYDI